MRKYAHKAFVGGKWVGLKAFGASFVVATTSLVLFAPRIIAGEIERGAIEQVKATAAAQPNVGPGGLGAGPAAPVAPL